MRIPLILLAATLVAVPVLASAAASSAAAFAPPDLVFAESGGLVAFEAEHFLQQELATVRAWHVTHAGHQPKLPPDTDGTHVSGASGGAYLEALPDTRWSPDEKLVPGENFSGEPGKLAILSYRVRFTTPGRYHVWARVFSTGPEDNGVHFGLNGTWPASGQRWQTVKKGEWAWDSRQRTEQVHVGVPGQLYLDIPSAGEHTIHVALREDGFELDKVVLTSDPKYVPEGTGPESRVYSGRPPAAFPVPAGYVEAPAITALPPKAPKPAAAQVPATEPAAVPPGTVLASELKLDGTGFYLDQGKWAAINPDQRKEASVKFNAPAANGRYRVTLHAVGENDGNSSYEVIVGSHSLGTFTCPPSKEMFEEGPAFTRTWGDVPFSQGETVEVRARTASNDGKENSRARWSRIVFTAVQDDPGHEAARVELAATQRAAAMKPVARQPAGNGAVTVTGELKQWHKVTVELAGPFAAESDQSPNPFTDLALNVTFTHESGTPRYVVPGYFAADGNAANTGARAGTVWRAHVSPDKPGQWNYRVAFTSGTHAALNGGGAPLAPFDGKSGSFTVARTDKTGRDFRAQGRLMYNGSHYLHYAGSGAPFLKAGADAPETLLAYTDFDDTIALKKNVPLKTWAPHVQDWRAGDPTWQGAKGKGLVGALNYLAGKGANSFSYLTYNAAGDGDNVWPFVARDEKFHYDCSKLDQWGIVFDHATQLGLFLHFKLQENENDDNRLGAQRKPGLVPESLDGGAMGPERKLYFRELIARFGHALALNWNLGEENTQTAEEHRAMAQFLFDTDPYHHLIVIHSFPGPAHQDPMYEALLGQQSQLTGASAQNKWTDTHKLTLKWVSASAAAGRPWVVCNDEQAPASAGVPPDPGYQGFTGKDKSGKDIGYDLHDIRKATLWGNLMAGGAGVEYYFGYQLPENDLLCEDFRSRDQSWDYCRIALEFFRAQKIPLGKMANADELVGNPTHENSTYCLAQPGQRYLVYLPVGGEATLDLSGAPGAFAISWFNPRTGGPLAPGPRVTGGAAVKLVAPDSQDWLAVVRSSP
ncbi:MAG: DUF5060 domain-containing protein [Lacunisphaera sp.]|nr:DUF5060 domain-containing protein [Lacunisphaera sp.]